MNACMNWSMTLRSCTRGLLNEDDGVAGTALARRGRSHAAPATGATPSRGARAQGHPKLTGAACRPYRRRGNASSALAPRGRSACAALLRARPFGTAPPSDFEAGIAAWWRAREAGWRSEEHTSELQSLMRISYAVFCVKKIHQPT